jgi:Flp pilus assembly protein TadG
MKPMQRQQRGIVAVLVVIGLLALLAMVGLALDTGHLVLNKSRLQNTVDAAALAAAKVLDQTGSESQATAAARSVFDLNAANQPELSRVLSGADITVQYSNTLSPFAPGSTPANYVRVFADNFTMWTGFAALVGVQNTSTAATAVAGPSAPIGPGEACDLVPMMVCGDRDAGEERDWGYSRDNVTLLKIASNAPSGVGPGNFQLIRLGGPGANILRQNLAGGYDDCVEPTNTVETEPGNAAGPTAQGLNTRFGEYQGGGMNPANYPPDKIITEPSPGLDVAADGLTVVLQGNGQGNGTPIMNYAQDVSFTYDDYKGASADPANQNNLGEFRRRVLAVPIVNCSTVVNGQGTLPVLGFGCFFLLQRVVQRGNENFVYSEYIERCAADGAPGPAPGPVGGPGIYKIVLHNDPASPDS